MRPHRSRRRLLALLVAALPACGGGDDRPGAGEPAVGPADPIPAAPAAPLAPQIPRSEDPELVALREALEAGDLVAAARRVLAVEDVERPDADLLRARLCALRGDSVGAVRAIESARADHPDQGRVYAAAAEIHAAAGRLEAARDEIRSGLAASGPVPELERAQGVLGICTPGGAQPGLAHLLRARELDPDLPFLDTPLSQAHLLVGNLALANQDAPMAVAHARLGLVRAPGSRELERLLADALAGTGQYEEAVELLEAQLARGEDMGGTLALTLQRAATGSLLLGDKAQALQYYARARELGLNEEELGFGAEVLAAEAVRAIEAGMLDYESGHFAAAIELFEWALRCEPGSLEARNHLAVSRFRSGDPDGAAGDWRWVLETARERGIALPEPVHLNLARALFQAGRLEEIPPLLADYLEREPEGEWAAETRQMQARLAEGGSGE